MISHATLTTDSSYKEIFERLSQLTTPNICDANGAVRLMNSKISPVGSSTQCIGRAYTVDSHQDSLSIMQALDDRTAFLAFLNQPEDDMIPIILTIASQGAPYALVGGMCAAVAKEKGFGGVVIDGPCRDIEEIKKSELPFFAKGKCAKSGLKNKVGHRKEPIVCGGVVVEPGDIVFGDTDGVVVMNKAEAVAAIEKAEEIKSKEAIALQRILEGADFKDICNIEEHVGNLEAGDTSSRLRLTV